MNHHNAIPEIPRWQACCARWVRASRQCQGQVIHVFSFAIDKSLSGRYCWYHEVEKNGEKAAYIK